MSARPDSGNILNTSRRLPSVKKFEIVVNNKAYLVEVTKLSSNGALVSVNGVEYEVGMKELSAGTVSTPQPVKVVAPPPDTAATPAPSGQAQAEVETVGGLTTIKAPLPGLIIDVKVTVGDRIKPGDVLLVIETMKMENNVSSPVAGTVKEIKISSGQSVNEGTPLIVIEA
jgi:biotin carboxyl carrier protein